MRKPLTWKPFADLKKIRRSRDIARTLNEGYGQNIVIPLIEDLEDIWEQLQFHPRLEKLKVRLQPRSLYMASHREIEQAMRKV